MFPTGYSVSLIQSIYEELENQRVSSINTVKQNIESNFDLPLQDLLKHVENKLDTRLGKRSIANLIDRLVSLSNSIVNQNSELESQISAILSHNQSIVNELSDLRFGKKGNSNERGIQDVIKDVTQTVCRLQNFLVTGDMTVRDSMTEN